MISLQEIEQLSRSGKLSLAFPKPQPRAEQVDHATGVWVEQVPRRLEVTFYGLRFQLCYDEEEIKWQRGRSVFAMFVDAFVFWRLNRRRIALLAIHEAIGDHLQQLSNHARLELEADLRALRRQTAT